MPLITTEYSQNYYNVGISKCKHKAKRCPHCGYTARGSSVIRHMPKCRKVPAGEKPLDPVEVSCNESSLDTHSVFEASHDLDQALDEDAPEYTGRVGEKRLA